MLAFLVYLEPKERVWWLHLWFPPAKEFNCAPPNTLAGLRCHFETGKERGNGREGKRKGSKRTVRTARTGANTPSFEVNFWLRPWRNFNHKQANVILVRDDNWSADVGWFMQEEVVAITMNKYRKAHQLLVEAESGAQPGIDKKTMMTTTSKGDRSMSVTREITRVVRV